MAEVVTEGGWLTWLMHGSLCSDPFNLLIFSSFNSLVYLSTGHVFFLFFHSGRAPFHSLRQNPSPQTLLTTATVTT